MPVTGNFTPVLQVEFGKTHITGGLHMHFGFVDADSERQRPDKDFGASECDDRAAARLAGGLETATRAGLYQEHCHRMPTRA